MRADRPAGPTLQGSPPRVGCGHGAKEASRNAVFSLRTGRPNVEPLAFVGHNAARRDHKPDGTHSWMDCDSTSVVACTDSTDTSTSIATASPTCGMTSRCSPGPGRTTRSARSVLKHVLEHLGQRPSVYLAIMQELYRVCQDGAKIRVIVPHHRHDHFYNDPTHVRAVTVDGMTLFSQRLNRQWIAQGVANSPLGLYMGIDFELIEAKLKPSEYWHRLNPPDPSDVGALLQQGEVYNNLIEEVEMILRPVKPPGREAG